MNRIVATVTAFAFSAVIGGPAFAVELPYTGNGDPLGLTSSKSPAALLAASCETAAPALHVEVPYTGSGDPLGLTSSKCPPRGTQVPYTGNGDRDDLI